MQIDGVEWPLPLECFPHVLVQGLAFMVHLFFVGFVITSYFAGF